MFYFLLVTSVFLTASVGGKNILILGGNGFLGGETTIRLVESGQNVTLVNRGNVYFDSDSRVKPIVSNNIVCDREKSLSLECKDFINDSIFYDVVIDFTSYSPTQMHDVVQLLKRRVGLYIFISSAAVYLAGSARNNTKPRKEDEVVRPDSVELRREIEMEEPYGDKKLACEELLVKQEKERGFPFLIFRLPVAMGPRDTTYRWWLYQLWVLTHKVIHYPVHIPDGIRSELFSMVYVNDVADVIARVVAMRTAQVNSVKNQAFNLAFKEHIALPRIIKDIANYYGLDKVEHEGDDNSTWYLYPVALKGALDTSRAQNMLGWQPVPWREAMKNTCEFYHRAMTKKSFLLEKEIVLAQMLESVVPDEYYEAFLMNLKQHFGASVLDGVQLEGGIPEGAAGIETHSDAIDDARKKQTDEL